jgi:heme oxygenase (mycobilin-producing)
MKAQENAVFVAINAVEVPAERAEAFAERFANRAGAVSSSPGFVRFELFRPADGNTRWLVVTHWRSREDFNAWLESQSFGRGHAQERSGGPVATGSELWQFQVEQEESGPRTSED